MMKNKKSIKKLSRNQLLILLFVVVLITLAALELSHRTNFFGKEPIKVVPQDGLTEDQTKERVAADLENKQRSVEQDSGASASPTNKDIELSGKQEADGTITVFTKLYGYTSGSCELKISNGGESYQQTAEIVYQPEYSSCAGFSIPISELGPGEWNITLTLSGAQTASKSLILKVQ
jgi:hypothetical protein